MLGIIFNIYFYNFYIYKYIFIDYTEFKSGSSHPVSSIERGKKHRMNQIIIAAHGRLASGMKETLEFFGARNIVILEQTVQESGFEAKVEKILQQYAGQNCIVFTDLYGGSVNQIFFKNLRNYSFHLITGMNLAMILECAFTETDLDGLHLKEIIANACRQTYYMNDLLLHCGEEDD